MNKNFLMLVLTLTALTGCQKHAPSVANPMEGFNVINGTQVTTRSTNAAKSLVLVELLGPTGFARTFCTATLVGPHTVLTAAHCFDKNHVTNFASFRVVFANQIGVTNPALIRKGLIFKQHPEYNTDGRYKQDIALAVFEGGIPPGFATALMDSDTVANYAQNTLYVYGYGRSRDYTGISGEDLRASVGVLHRGLVQVSDNYYQFEDHYLVKTSSPAHVCQGDSGGPHFFSKNGITKVVGVTSATFGKVLPNGQHSCLEYSQATKVAVNYSWFKREEKIALSQYYR